MNRYDVVVLGGGLIGLSIAWELSKAGRSVAVLDRGEQARIASWAAGGILPPPASGALHDPLEQLRHYSHSLYEAWCADLLSESGIDPEFECCGGIYLGRTPGESAALLSASEQWQHDGLELENWTAADLAQREPRLAPCPQRTRIVFLPGEIQVRPSRILRALRIALMARDVTFVKTAWEGNASGDGGRWSSVLTADGEFFGRQFCVTTGPWTTRILSTLGVDVPIEPRRGQMVLWKLASRPLHHIVNEGPRYLIARRDGHLLAGSTVEDVGFRNEPTSEGLREITQFAHGLLPELEAHQPIDHWSALRPMTSDGLPYLDRLPGYENVFVAAGHFRSGIHLAPATARLMTQSMLGQSLELDLHPFQIAR